MANRIQQPGVAVRREHLPLAARTARHAFVYLLIPDFLRWGNLFYLGVLEVMERAPVHLAKVEDGGVERRRRHVGASLAVRRVGIAAVTDI